MMNENNCILSVRGLDIRFNLRGRVLHAIRGIDLDLYRGEVLAVVGESGSGKSVFTKSFMGLLDTNGSITGGTIDYCPTPGAEPVRLSGLKTEKDWLRIRGREIAMIMQDPMTSLNPLKTIGDQILEAVTLHQGLKGTEARAKTLEYLRDVGISDPEVRFKQYPHEFSGGMRQRVVIAIAVACSPKILICDEPTTALDVTIQAQILQLLKELRAKYHLTIVMITHDLGVVANIADRVAVMYAGDIVEIGTADEIYYDPRHPYTWALLSSMPQMGIKGEDLFNIVGTPPNLFAEIRGDAFAPRNPQALKIDYVKRPPYFEVSPTHKAKTCKLKYGHRGANQPVTSPAKQRTFITSQNHGYAVMADTLPESVGQMSYFNANDGTCEGVDYLKWNCFTVQFHPEANGGPKDTEFLFDQFVSRMLAAKGVINNA